MRAALVCLLLLLFALPARADEDVERRSLPGLGALGADAVGRFEDGERARRRGDFGDAARLYASAESAAPSYAPFARRTCGALVAAGRHDEAVTSCRRAVSLDRAPINLLALATALSSAGATETELREARDLVFAASPNGERDPVASCESVVITTAGTMAACLKPLVDRENARVAPAPPPAPSWRRAIPTAFVLLAVLVTYLAARGRRRSAAPRPPEERLREIAGEDKVIARSALPAEPTAAVDRLLALTDGGATGMSCACIEKDGARVLVMSLRDAKWEARIDAEDLAPVEIVRALNDALAHVGSKGRLYVVRDVIAFATDAQMLLIVREGLAVR